MTNDKWLMTNDKWQMILGCLSEKKIMLPEQLQRIIGFLEEATEHIQIIEQGLQGLQNPVQAPQSIHQLIRASHSIKGGAAMLGFSSIQRVAIIWKII